MKPICPYCRTEIGEGEHERLDCPGCATPHHPECFAENGGCTVFGCSKAPADEAKINVSGSELNPAAPPTPGRPVNVAGRLSLLGSPGAPPPQQSTAPAPAASAPPPPPAAGGTGVAPPPAPSMRPAYASVRAVRLPLQPGPRNRVTFVLLGIFLGIFGMHNFYAGYNKKAAIQLALTVLTCFYGAIISWVWAIAEVCIISQDADGEQFA